MKKEKINIIVADCEEQELNEFKKALEQNSSLKFKFDCAISNWQRSGIISELKRYFSYFYMGFKLFINRNKYNIIISWQQFDGLFYSFLCNLFKVKKVNKVYVLNYTYKEKKGLIGKIYKNFMQICMRNNYIDYYHLPGKKAIENTMEQFDISKEKFIDIPFGINDLYKKYAQERNPENCKYYLSIGRSNRDYDFLVSAWSNIKNNLIIISDTYEITNKKENIKILNNISGNEQYKYIINCEALIIPIDNPSIASGDTVLLTAFSFKKKVVVTMPSNLGNTYVKNNINGYLIMKNKIDLEKTIDKIENDTKNKVGLAARTSFEQKYSRYSMGEKLIKIIIKESK